MSVAFYNKMREENGTRCVWQDEDYCGVEYFFSMGDSLLNEGECEAGEFEDYCEGKDYIKCISPQDEIMHCVVVKDLSLLDEVEKKFIEEWIGSNCYTL